MNKTNQPYKLTVNVKSFKNGKTEILNEQNQYIVVKQGELKQGLIKIKIPKKDLTSYKVPVDLEIKEAKGKPIDDYVISFMAPF